MWNHERRPRELTAGLHRSRRANTRFLSVLRGACFVALYFVAPPGVLVWLNGSLGWPRWGGVLLDLIGVSLFVGGIGTCIHCSLLF